MSKYDALRTWIRHNGSDRFSPAFAGIVVIAGVSPRPLFLEETNTAKAYLPGSDK